MVLLRRLLQIPEVGGHAGQAQHAGLLIQQVHGLGDGHVVLVGNELHHAHVHITGPGAHGQARQRRQAHGGIHAAAAVDGGQGGAVAQVAGHHLQLRRVAAQKLRRPQGHIAVRGAMEAVAADLVVFIVLIGDGVQIRMLGHGLVEGRVEHRHLGHIVAQDGPAGLDADDVGRIMQRRQGGAVLHRLHHLVGDEDGAGEALAAVDHPVTHRVDLLHGGDDAVVRVHQGGQHRLDGLGMGGHGDVRRRHGGLALHLGLIGEFSVNADALAQAFGQQMAGFRVQQLILQG